MSLLTIAKGDSPPDLAGSHFYGRPKVTVWIYAVTFCQQLHALLATIAFPGARLDALAGLPTGEGA